MGLQQSTLVRQTRGVDVDDAEYDDDEVLECGAASGFDHKRE